MVEGQGTIKRMQEVLRESRQSRGPTVVVSIKDLEHLLALALGVFPERYATVHFALGSVRGLNIARRLIATWQGETHPPEDRPLVDKHADRLSQDIADQIRLYERTS